MSNTLKFTDFVSNVPDHAAIREFEKMSWQEIILAIEDYNFSIMYEEQTLPMLKRALAMFYVADKKSKNGYLKEVAAMAIKNCEYQIKELQKRQS